MQAVMVTPLGVDIRKFKSQLALLVILLRRPHFTKLGFLLCKLGIITVSPALALVRLH